MAELNEVGIPGVSEGILHPALQHRWRFVVKTKDQSLMKFITMNTIRCNVDYLNDSILIEVQENILGHVSDVVYDLAQGGQFNCSIDMMDGCDGVAFSNEFLNTNVVEHTVSYDYAESGVVTHKMKLKFGIFRLLVPALETAP